MTNPDTQLRRVVILGSTGSIGTQTLGVIAHLNALADQGRAPIRYEVVGLAAGRNADLLAEQSRAHPGARLALADENAAFNGSADHDPIRGPDAALELVRVTEADLVVAAMVGAAGLPATLAAIEAGTDVALANKETLVVAGALVIAAAERTGARLLPVDSEHAAVWHTLRSSLEPGLAPPLITPGTVRRVIITASGGAFRDRTLQEVEHATPQEALDHPTWNMGAKVTIDSATMLNKGLELIEAHHLFGLDNDRLGVLIQRQSVVHALAQLNDGAIIAHLSATDMSHPIHCALAHPHTIDAPDAATLDPDTLTRLDFQTVDPERFPAVRLARRVIDAPNTTAGAIFNAANEAAAAAFLDRRVPFGSITRLVERTLDSITAEPLTDIPTALDADARARAAVEDAIRAHAEV